MNRILTLLILILTLSCDNEPGDQEYIKKPTEPETLKWLKEQKGFIATEEDIEEHKELTKGLSNKIIENPPARLENQISDFIDTKFENQFPEQRVLVYHPKVVSRTDKGEGWSEPRAFIDTTTYSVDLLLMNDNDTIRWQLAFNNDFLLLYDIEK